MRDKKFSKVILIFILFIVTAFFRTSAAQSGDRRLPVDYSHHLETDNSSVLFNLMASNNGININSIRWEISFSLFTSAPHIRKDFIETEYQIKNISISGDTRFRQFKTDSLLIPDSAVAEVRLINGHNTYGVYRTKISFTGGRLLFEKKSGFSPPTHVIITVLEPFYSDNNKKRFIATANLINHYYGYSLLYRKVLNHFGRLNLKSDNPPSEVLTSLLALQRLQDFSERHGFELKLGLAGYDPEKLLRQQEKLARMLRRAKTLTERKLQTGPPVESQSQFVSCYTELSLTALREAKNLQPYRAESFKEFASVNKSEFTKNILQKTGLFYGSQTLLPQDLFDKFTSLAGEKLQQKAFVDGLIFAGNALFFYSGFKNVKRTATFIHTYGQLTDGLMDAYMLVALSARKIGNQKMFDEYYEKAVLLLHRSAKDTAFADSKMIYPKMRTHLLQLAYDTTVNPFISLQFATEALLANAGMKNPAIDSAFFLSYARQADLILAAARTQLDRGRPLAAKKLIDSCTTFIQTRKNINLLSRKYLPEIKKAAYPVYLEILQQGEISADKHQTAKSLTFLSAAEEMEDRYFDFHSEELAKLIERQFTPAALSVLRKASLEIWANRSENAIKIIKEVQSMQKARHQQDNGEVNRAIEELKRKIRQKSCENYHNELNNLIASLESRIHTGQWEKALKLYRQAETLSASETDCPENDIPGKITNRYADLFDFYIRNRELKKIIFRDGLEAALPQYIATEKLYKQKIEDKFDIPFVDLYRFVASQKSRTLAGVCFDYFTGKGNPSEALRYLELLRKLGVPPSETRSKQRKLAKLYREQKIIASDKIFETDWYEPFRLAYSGKILNINNKIKNAGTSY